MRHVEVVRGLVMPFFPMRPIEGRKLRTPALIDELIQLEASGAWIIQPALNGLRVCVALVDGDLHVQDKDGKWRGAALANANVFRTLPDKTCLDGVVYADIFYPFEVLARNGKLLVHNPARLRIEAAELLCRQLGIPWKFGRPSREWLLARQKNMPEFKGVVLKKADSSYTLMGTGEQRSTAWLTKNWGKPFDNRSASRRKLDQERCLA